MMRSHSIEIGVDKNQLIGSHGASNRAKHSQIERLGIRIIPLAIPFGDYILITDNIKKLITDKGSENIAKKDLQNLIIHSVDTKKNLVELCGNVCQDHERFKRELLRSEGRLTILVEEADITCLEDVWFWENPRLKYNKRAVKGSSLYKSLCTIQEEYGIGIDFCSRRETGKRIIEILERRKGDEVERLH